MADYTKMVGQWKVIEFIFPHPYCVVPIDHPARFIATKPRNVSVPEKKVIEFRAPYPSCLVPHDHPARGHAKETDIKRTIARHMP